MNRSIKLSLLMSACFIAGGMKATFGFSDIPVVAQKGGEIVSNVVPVIGEIKKAADAGKNFANALKTAELPSEKVFNFIKLFKESAHILEALTGSPAGDVQKHDWKGIVDPAADIVALINATAGANFKKANITVREIVGVTDSVVQMMTDIAIMLQMLGK